MSVLDLSEALSRSAGTSPPALAGAIRSGLLTIAFRLAGAAIIVEWARFLWWAGNKLLMPY